MSDLRDAFEEIVREVPVYGDLDSAFDQADRMRRRRHGAVAGLIAAAAVLVAIIGLVAVSRDTDTAPPVSPTPTPSPTSGPTPGPTGKSQSPQTWADTEVDATRNGKDWVVPDPFDEVRGAWLPVAAEHLDPDGDLAAFENYPYSWTVQFRWPAEGSDYEATTAATSAYDAYGILGLKVDPGRPNLLDDGCGYFRAEHGNPNGAESCTSSALTGPDGERARVASWGRRCTSWEGGGPAPATCGDYEVGVAVERRDGLVGYVVVSGRGTPDFTPVSPDAMAAAAADPRLAIPQRAFAVPSDGVVAAVVEDHVPGFRPQDPRKRSPYVTQEPGYGWAGGPVGRRWLAVHVLPAGPTPTCGRNFLVECLARRVFGADDPTTVFVGAWDEEGWADCCPKNSRADSRELVYVGPRHTVVATQHLIVREDEDPIGADLDQRLIDVLLDPRLQ